LVFDLQHGKPIGTQAKGGIGPTGCVTNIQPRSSG